MTQLMKQAWRTGADRLRAANIETPLLDARLLLQHVLGISYETFLLQAANVEVPPAQIKAYEALIERRLAHEPAAYLLGHKEFFGLNFMVTRDTLIPRPDSETIVEAALEAVGTNQAPTILDLGTGTGCLLLSLLHALPQATGTGVDVSKAALVVAKRNAESLQLADRAEFIESAWCAALPQKKYEIVVANPPYIASNDVRALMPEVAEFEPHLALDGGEDGLSAYRRIAQELPSYVARDAIVAIEAGADQAEAIAGIFADSGFRRQAIKRDLSGIARCVVFRSE